ncbi:helix-turn-helix domain-containing protein [Bifidobacterium choloepi]|uniref:Helix-turn-helix domain-containing protein n=1 Tax=Bifidobacterium choloepi TaxID=2614131 RepID=A0A6I5N0T0_9BIFI|nr:helix-turn-helix domain-containing protein [Bifidobacterium choloepi]NEG69735.1 helix-turn-helix domain-containing protein [Bifidobacterium choloepi]
MALRIVDDSAPVQFALRGNGMTYELDERAYEAALKAAEEAMADELASSVEDRLTHAVTGISGTAGVDDAALEPHVDESDRMVTTGKAAKILHVSTRTVARMVDAGKLVAFRYGETGHRLISLESLLAYRDEHLRRCELLSQARDLADDAGLHDDDPASLPKRTR